MVSVRGMCTCGSRPLPGLHADTHHTDQWSVSADHPHLSTPGHRNIILLHNDVYRPRADPMPLTVSNFSDAVRMTARHTALFDPAGDALTKSGSAAFSDMCVSKSNEVPLSWENSGIVRKTSERA